MLAVGAGLRLSHFRGVRQTFNEPVERAHESCGSSRFGLDYWLILGSASWLNLRPAPTHILSGFKFASGLSLIFAALLLGVVNSTVKPLLFWLTIPLTVLTFGIFLLVINACVILLVSALVRGFKVSSFGTACLASLFISAVRFVLELILIDPQYSWSSMHSMQWM
jgi:putative membrane protein